MSPSSAQQWARRVRYADQHLRVSDAERNAVAELLGQHYADGRLDQAEFDERVNRAMTAKTRGDLAGLFDDLPDLQAKEGAAPASPVGTDGPALPYRPRRRGSIVRPLILVFLVLVGANIAWHLFIGMFFIKPLLLAFIIVAAVMILSRMTHRR